MRIEFLALTVAITLAQPGRADDPAITPPNDGATKNAAATTAGTDSPAGLWLGTLPAGGQELRVVFEIVEKDGKLSGSLDSIDQGVKGLKASEVTFKNGELTFVLKMIGATYSGKRTAEGFDGVWKQGPAELPLAIKRIKARPTSVRKQDPKPPFPYREVEVKVVNEKAKPPVTLAGTLTVPAGAGPHPSVILISGMGPQNRDGEEHNHRPFRVLADHLARQGIASLRLDDRGVGGSSKGSPEDTTADHADDVRAALAFLKTRPELDPARRGLLGFSEGAMIGPMLAAEQPDDVSFLVLLAGAAVKGEEVLVRQTAVILAVGATMDSLDEHQAIQREIFAIVRREKDNGKAAAMIADALARLEKDGNNTAAAIRQAPEGPRRQAEVVCTTWMRHFLDLDPAPSMAKVRCPVLALNGERDLEVSARQSLPEIEKALKTGVATDVTVKAIPKLNHHFQTCDSGSNHEYSVLSETMSPVALELISGWITERTKRKPG
jgi:hypothetical protein